MFATPSTSTTATSPLQQRFGARCFDACNHDLGRGVLVSDLMRCDGPEPDPLELYWGWWWRGRGADQGD